MQVVASERGAAGARERSHRVETQKLASARDFFQRTLDSLPTHIAVLDEHGEIIMTNRAWSAFALANDARAIEGIGANYLTACDAAKDDQPAGRAAAGLRAIIAGGRSEFTIEYPCHGPDGERWFVLRAARLEGPGPTRVVVAHDDITIRRAAEVATHTSERIASERALLAAQNYMRAVADSMGEGLFTLDPEGHVVFLNQAAEKLLGWSTQELRGRVMHDVAHTCRPDGTRLPIEDCPIVRARRDGVTVRIENDVFICRDGRALPVAYTAAPFVTDDGVEGCVVVFEDITERRARQESMEDDVKTLSWISRIQDALVEDRFVLYAQPIIDLSSGRVVQRELLLRMREASGEIVLPDSYLPVAEQYGLIGDIDRWVIERATEIAVAGGAVELNVSAYSIADPTLLDDIERALKRTGVDPTLLVFEITETALIADVAAAKAFADRLHRLGCKLALDDFGTGYGGFTYLKQFPVDFLKIDIEFVRDLPTNPASRHVVEAVVVLAQAFGLKTVGEGVEDVQTLGLLRELGVDFAQGYHIARPGPLENCVTSATPSLLPDGTGLSIEAQRRETS